MNCGSWGAHRGRSWLDFPWQDLKSLLGYTAEFQMSKMIFLAPGQFQSVLKSIYHCLSWKKTKNRSTTALIWDVTSLLPEEWNRKRHKGLWIFFNQIDVFSSLALNRPQSPSPIYGQWSSSRLWTLVVLHINIWAVWLGKFLGYLVPKYPTMTYVNTKNEHCFPFSATHIQSTDLRV